MSLVWGKSILLLGVGTVGLLALAPPTMSLVPPSDATIVLNSFAAAPESQVIELRFPASAPNVVTWVRPAGVLSGHVPSSRDPLGITPDGSCFSFVIGTGAGETHTETINADCWVKNHMEIQWHCLFHTGVNGVLRLVDDDLVGTPYYLGPGQNLHAGPNAVNPTEKVHIVAGAGSVKVIFQNGALATQNTGSVVVPAGTVADLAVPPGAEPFPTTQFVLNLAPGSVLASGAWQRVPA